MWVGGGGGGGGGTQNEYNPVYSILIFEIFDCTYINQKYHEAIKKGIFQKNVILLSQKIGSYVQGMIYGRVLQAIMFLYLFFPQIILAIGNYMNSSKRGAVYGFKLQSLDMVSIERKLC